MIMRAVLLTLVIPFMLLLGCAPIEAQELETVVVSANRAEITNLRTPMSINSIGRAEIEASGALQVSDLLRGQGGVQVSDLFGDGHEARVDMRGFGGSATDNTLVLVDGRRLNNADLGEPDLNFIALKDVERMEVIRGSAGVLYGDKAVGGVINIVTRQADTMRVGLELEGGNYARRGVKIDAQNRHANGLGYRFSAVRRLSENYRDANVQHYSNLHGGLDFRHGGGRIFAEYSLVDEDRKTPGALFADQILRDRRQPLNPGDFINTDTGVGRFGIVQRLFGEWDLYAEYTNRKSDSDGILSTFGSQSFLTLKRHHREITPRVVGSMGFPAGRATLMFGADLFATDYRLFSSVGTTINDQRQWSVYARGILPITTRLTLTAGARYASVENDIFASTTFLGVSLPHGSQLEDDANAEELGLVWQINPEWRVFVRGETNYRFPNADEFSGIANFNLFPFPGPLPAPTTQTGNSMDFGVEWNGREAHAKLLFYRLSVNDEIAFEPNSGQNFNVGDSRRLGLVVEGQITPLPGLRINASYSYIDAELTSGVFDGADATFVASHSGRMHAEYQIDDATSGYVEFIGIGDRTLTGDFRNSLPALSGRVIANVNLSYRWRALTAQFRLNNLWDHQYSDAGNLGFDFRDPFFPVVPTFFPAPGRNFLVKLRYLYE